MMAQAQPVGGPHTVGADEVDGLLRRIREDPPALRPQHSQYPDGTVSADTTQEEV